MSETQETKKIITYEKFEMYDALIKAFVNGKIFVGTTEEYNTAHANGKISEGCLVCIIDDNEGGSGSGGSTGGSTDTSSTTAVLGYAILGQMILG